MPHLPPLTGDLRLDHVALPYSADDGGSRIRAFWQPLGLRVTERQVSGNIDHAGPGMRYDVGDVTHTWVVYYPDLIGAAQGHVAFTVTPYDFERLIAHPDRDHGSGTNGISRFGRSGASIFFRDPYGARVEFHCPSASQELASRLV